MQTEFLQINPDSDTNATQVKATSKMRKAFLQVVLGQRNRQVLQAPLYLLLSLTVKVKHTFCHFTFATSWDMIAYESNPAKEQY